MANGRFIQSVSGLFTSLWRTVPSLNHLLPSSPAENEADFWEKNNETEPDLATKISELFDNHEYKYEKINAKFNAIRFPDLHDILTDKELQSKYPSLYQLSERFMCSIYYNVMGAPVVINNLYSQKIDITALYSHVIIHQNITCPFTRKEITSVELDFILRKEIQCFVEEMKLFYDNFFQENILPLHINDFKTPKEYNDHIATLLLDAYEEKVEEYLKREELINQILMPLKLSNLTKANKEKLDRLHVQLQYKFRKALPLGSEVTLEKLQALFTQASQKNPFIQRVIDRFCSEKLSEIKKSFIKLQQKWPELTTEINGLLANIEKAYREAAKSELVNVRLARLESDQYEKLNLLLAREKHIKQTLKPLTFFDSENTNLNGKAEQFAKYLKNKIRKSLQLNAEENANEMFEFAFNVINDTREHINEERTKLEKELETQENISESIALKIEALSALEKEINNIEIRFQLAKDPNNIDLMEERKNTLDCKAVLSKAEIKEYAHLIEQLNQREIFADVELKTNRSANFFWQNPFIHRMKQLHPLQSLILPDMACASTILMRSNKNNF